MLACCVEFMQSITSRTIVLIYYLVLSFLVVSVMPKMNGPTATKEIRALGYKGPIFGVTGNGLESDINLFMSCGADRVHIKPLYLTDFNQAMKNMRLRSSVKVGHTDVPH